MMQRSPEEIAALRKSFREMDTAHKAEYIYMYYKWYILIGLVVLAIIGSTVHRQLTHREPVLFVGLANVTVGPEMEAALTDGFLEYAGIGLRKNQVLPYTGMYLSADPATENHQYAYASRMKVMAASQAQRLDVMILNREAFDLLSRSGYLMDLSGLPDALKPYLIENDVVLEDNSIEVQLNEADAYHEVTQSVFNGLDVSRFPIFQNAGFDGSVYAAVIGNTPRPDTAVSYLEYLLTKQ